MIDLNNDRLGYALRAADAYDRLSKQLTRITDPERAANSRNARRGVAEVLTVIALMQVEDLGPNWRRIVRRHVLEMSRIRPV